MRSVSASSSSRYFPKQSSNAKDITALTPKSDDYYTNEVTPSPRTINTKQPLVVWRSEKLSEDSNVSNSSTIPPEFPHQERANVVNCYDGGGGNDEFYQNTPMSPRHRNGGNHDNLRNGNGNGNVNVNVNGNRHSLYSKQHRSPNQNGHPTMRSLRGIHSNRDNVRRPRKHKPPVIHRGSSANNNGMGMNGTAMTIKKRKTMMIPDKSNQNKNKNNKNNQNPFYIERGISVSSSNGMSSKTPIIPLLVDTQSVNDRMLLKNRMIPNRKRKH